MITFALSLRGFGIYLGGHPRYESTVRFGLEVGPVEVRDTLLNVWWPRDAGIHVERNRRPPQPWSDYPWFRHWGPESPDDPNRSHRFALARGRIDVTYFPSEPKAPACNRVAEAAD